MAEEPIDTTNEFVVGMMASGKGITIFNPPQRGEIIETDRALKLAAYIVIMADYKGERFEEIKKAIANA